MAAFNKFESFITAVAAGTHVNCLNADSDVIKAYLSNATPSASADLLKADLAEISNENGYAAPVDTQNAASTSSGTITVVGTDIVITASGGTVGPFRYVALFNDTATDDPLIAWWDYGSAVTLQAGETFTIDFGANMFTLG